MAGKPKGDKPTKSEAETQKERRQRFLDVAPRRVDRVVTSIRALAKCSSKNYVYDQLEVNKILAYLDNELSDMKDSFSSKTKTVKTAFNFKD